MASSHKGKKPYCSRETTAQRDKLVWELRTQKMWTQDQIAVHLNMDQATVSRSLSRTAKRLSADMDQRVQQYRESLLAQLDRIISDTYAAWTRAQSEPNPSPATANYITANLKAMERIGKLLGLEKQQERIAGLSVEDILATVEKAKESE